MWATVQRIAEIIEEIAPLTLALEGDNPGLQVGDPRAPVQLVLAALEMDRAVLEEARARKAGLIVTHHPLIYRPLTALDRSTPEADLIAQIIHNNINLYSAHTNLDAAPGGVSHLLADRLGLSPDGRTVLEQTAEDRLLKLAVFVPFDHAGELLEALAGAGAGWIGRYSHCTFQVKGTGTFLPRDGANPTIGKRGRLERVEEVRLETILPESKCAFVVEAMLRAHPYEEVAYDLYTLERPGRPAGLGVVGQLDEPATLEQILDRCRRELPADVLRFWAPEKGASFSRIAVCGGSGGRLVEQAVRSGAQLYISGDFGYHDLLAAADYGLALIDAGHYATEAQAVDFLAEHLRRRLAQGGFATTVHSAVSGRIARWSSRPG